MSSQVSLTMTFRHEDIPLFDKAFKCQTSFLKLFDEIDANSGALRTLTGTVDFAKFAWRTELEAAAIMGCVFHGRHGSNCDIPAGEFCAIDGQYSEAAVYGMEYRIGVQSDGKTLRVRDEDVGELTEFLGGVNRAMAVLDGEEVTPPPLKPVVARVIVVVRNGVVTGACSDDPRVQVEVLDYDDLEAPGAGEPAFREATEHLRALEEECDTMTAVY